MEQLNNKSMVALAMSAAMLLGVSNQSAAQSEPTSNEGPDGLDRTGDRIVVDGSDLGPNEISLSNAIELVCPELVDRVPRPAPPPAPEPEPEEEPVITDPQFPNLLGRALVKGQQTRSDPRSPGEIDLQRRCTELVQYRGRTEGREGDFTDLNTILRELNVDEAAAQSRGLVEFSAIRIAGVAARLKTLRVADAGARDRAEMVAFQADPGQLDYHFETGGGAGDGDFSRWSVYANGELFGGDRDPTALEAGFDLDGGRITLGTDYRVRDNLFVGASLDYIAAAADFDNDSELDTDGLDLTLYGTSYTDTGLYFEGTIGAGTSDYSQDRRFRYVVPAVPGPVGSGPGVTIVDQTASSDTDGDQWFASLGVGKDVNVGAGLTASFSGYLDYLDATIDGFTETITGGAPGSGMALTVGDQDISSLRSTLGAQISKAISTERGVVLPFARAEWIHEFDNDSRTIIARFAEDAITTTSFQLTTEEPDEDYFRLGGGLSTVLAGGLQAFVSVDTVLGLDDLSYYSITAGISKEL